MFWKKDKGGVTAPGKGTEAPKKLTPKEIMIGQLEAIETDKEITFKLGAIYVKPYVTIVRNAAGKRFTVYQDGKDEEGNPAGKRGKFWDADHAKDIVNWIVEREGTLFNG